MKNTVKVFGVIALMAVIVFSTTACSKKSSGGESSSGSSSGSVKSAGKEAPATDFQYDLTEDGKGISIRKYTGKGGKVVIPAKIEDYPVVEIGEANFFGPGAFQGQTDSEYLNANEITEIVIPDSVVKIGERAFAQIDNLKSANIPASIERIGDKVFYKCENLETLTIPDSLTKISFYSYDNENAKSNTSFFGCGKLLLKTRQRLQELGYTSGKF